MISNKANESFTGSELHHQMYMTFFKGHTDEEKSRPTDYLYYVLEAQS